MSPKETLNKIIGTEAPDEFISATSENDNLLGGQGTTEFLFNVGNFYGGSDIVTDTGTNSDDRIYIQKLQNNPLLGWSKIPTLKI